MAAGDREPGADHPDHPDRPDRPPLLRQQSTTSAVVRIEDADEKQNKFKFETLVFIAVTGVNFITGGVSLSGPVIGRHLVKVFNETTPIHTGSIFYINQRKNFNIFTFIYIVEIAK